MHIEEKDKLIFIVNTTAGGGAGKIVRFAAEACSDENDVTVIELYEEGKDIDIDGYHLVRLGCVKRNFAWRINLIQRLRRCIRLHSPRIVCAFISDIAVISRIATLGLRLTFISAERGDPYTQSTKWDRLVKWAYNTSDYCIFQLEKARDYYGSKVVAKSFVINNPCIPPDNVVPYFGERKKTVVSVGRFAPEKGYDILIKAFSNVVKKHPDYKLILYGDGPCKNDLLGLVENLCLKAFVSFPGYISNSETVIRCEGIFVLPSRFEGIPNALIEALSIGIPTISTNCTPGGPDLLTDHGKRGMLVPVGDVKSLENAIDVLIENPELRKEYSLRGPEILSVFSKDVISERWRDAFAAIKER